MTLNILNNKQNDFIAPKFNYRFQRFQQINFQFGWWYSYWKKRARRHVYVFDPYNPLNKEIQQKDIEDILRRYGITVPIYNEKLYKRAFINKSYLRRPDVENRQNNITVIAGKSSVQGIHYGIINRNALNSQSQM